ncbi:MAG: hypothetical protein J5965_15535 [Aeriscardovia sp.]|nr:hypothetical protein [Aeriscardovia sp.]MBP3787847.1 hypothetical protein [Prevotella sp.]
MATILKVLSVSNKNSIQDRVLGNQGKLYLTLADKDERSDNRFYVSLSGKDAFMDWQLGDRIMVELNFIAYKNKGQWHNSYASDAIEIIEIGNINDNKRVYNEYNR